MLRLFTLITLLFCLCTNGNTNVNDSSIDGWLRVDLFSSTRTLDHRSGTGSAELGVKYSHDINELNKFRFESKFYQDLRDGDNDIYFVETYWQQRNELIDLLRVGWQKISWGKADGLNPTDFFTPYDYTVVQPFEEDQRRSVPVIRSDILLSQEQILSLVAEPYFVEGKLPTPYDLNLSKRKPDGFRRPQLGARLLSTSNNFDWSISAFRGYLTTPLFGATETGLYQYYSKLNGFGADVARNFGQWGGRAEIAWLEPYQTDETGIQPFFYSVIGIDRGSADWNVNFQLVARYTPNFRHHDAGTPTRTLLSIADRQNAVNFGQLHSTQFGFTSRLSNRWLNQTLEGEILLIGYFNPGNIMGRVNLTYAITDKNQITVGGEYYIGPELSFFGQMKLNRTFFLSYRHFF